MTRNHQAASFILSDLADRIRQAGNLTHVSVALVRDGSMRLRLTRGDRELFLRWSERSRGTGVEVALPDGDGVVSPERPAADADPNSRRAVYGYCVHVARQIGQLRRESESPLLTFRNRNQQTLHWGVRMFHRLCPGLIEKGRTRYYDYRLTAMDEYGGVLNLEFSDRKTRVVLRLTLPDLLDQEPLIRWGSIALVIVEDERTDRQRAAPDHQVEEFLGYLLSRNLPTDFTLAFERGDPPPGHFPPDFNIDLLNLVPPDDSGWFHMIFASNEKVAVACSCDRECFNLFSFVSAPPDSTTITGPWTVAPSSDLFRHIYQADLVGDAALMGGDRPARCLDAIASSPSPPDLIILIDSCLSQLVGEDIQGIAARFRETSRIPLVVYDIKLTQGSGPSQVATFWENVYDAICEEDLAARPGRVCLLGSALDSAGELERDLGELGIEIGSRIFPHLRVADIREVRSCSLAVLNCWHFTETMFSGFTDRLGRQVVRLPLPFGFQATRDWLDTVSRAADGDGVGALMENERTRRLQERFAEATRRTRGRRIGVFARYRDAVEQLSARRRFGIDVLGIFRELGLGIDLNLFVPDGDKPDLDRLRGDLRLDEKRGDSVALYTHYRELVPRIETGDFPLVYSETFRDARVTAAGKNAVSVRDLHPGFGGAVRTARTISGLLDNRFYARYRPYLSQPYDTYRVQPKSA